MEFFICLAFLFVGLVGSNRAISEESYLFGKKGLEVLSPLKMRFGLNFGRLAALFSLVSLTLLSTIGLKCLVKLFSEENLISSAYIILFSALMLWRGGFWALVRVLSLLLILTPFLDYPLPFAFIAGSLALGSIWNIETTLIIHHFLKSEPKESFLRAGCITAILMSCTYLGSILFTNEIGLQTVLYATLPFLSLLFAQLFIFWKRSHYLAAYSSSLTTLGASIFTLDVFLLISLNLSVGIITSLLVTPKKLPEEGCQKN